MARRVRKSGVKEVALSEVKDDLSRYLHEAETQEIVITRHDKPVARLVPEGARRHDEVCRAVDGLRELQRRIARRSKAKLSDREVRTAIDQFQQLVDFGLQCKGDDGDGDGDW